MGPGNKGLTEIAKLPITLHDLLGERVFPAPTTMSFVEVEVIVPKDSTVLLGPQR